VIRALGDPRNQTAELPAGATLVAWDSAAPATNATPLTFSVAGTDRFALELRYRRPPFDDASIRRLGDHLLTLLSGLAAGPTQAVGLLPLLTEPERYQLLLEWNDTGAPDAPRCVHHLFEEQAARAPGAVAVIYGEERLTYGELNTRANHLAHYLRTQGVGPDVLVGLCLDRTPDLFVAILGVLKAGGA
jgi:non-ribosomal peptide synthetase component F